MKLIITICALVIFHSTAFAIGNDPNAILEEVKSNYNKVHDYQAQVKIKLDMDFLKVPMSEAVLYFKQPDKMRIKSDGFAMLPRKGFNFFPGALLRGNYTAIFEQDKTFDKSECYVIKIIPSGEMQDVVLTTLWIDKAGLMIRRVESVTKASGVFSIDLYYDKSFVKQYPLPASIKFEFDISKGNNQFGLKDDGNSAPEKKKKFSNGTAYVYFSDYKVNAGVDDTIFLEKKTTK